MCISSSGSRHVDEAHVLGFDGNADQFSKLRFALRGNWENHSCQRRSS